MFPLVNGMVLLVLVVCFLECPAVRDTVENTREKSSITNNLDTDNIW